jgi:hypothetical protein
MCDPASGFEQAQVQALPRLVPDALLPPYSYVTGRFPHPTSDPAGHSYGHVPAPSEAIDPQRWNASRDFLLGCDLFNHGYYWEAHETWESSWKACGRRGTTADFLKGLIKLAAAGVKVREGRADGVARHGARAGSLFRQVRAEVPRQRYLGLDLDTLIGFADRLTRRPSLPCDDEAAVEVLFATRLLPTN